MQKWFKRLATALLVLAALLALACVFRAPLLRGAASVWIVNDRLSHADVIVVLGGGPETRPFEAVRLFQQGLASKILLMNPKPTPTAQLGLSSTDAAVARNVLLKKGVPAADIFITADVVNSTYDEALAVRNWAKANNVKHLIIVTDVFHTRRVRWLFRKELGHAGIQVQMDATPVREYTATDWWQHESGIVAFQNELFKYAYYRVKY